MGQHRRHAAARRGTGICVWAGEQPAAICGAAVRFCFPFYPRPNCLMQEVEWREQQMSAEEAASHPSRAR